MGRCSLGPRTGDVNRVAPAQALGVVGGNKPAFGSGRIPVDMDCHRCGQHR